MSRTLGISSSAASSSSSRVLVAAPRPATTRCSSSVLRWLRDDAAARDAPLKAADSVEWRQHAQANEAVALGFHEAATARGGERRLGSKTLVLCLHNAR